MNKPLVSGSFRVGRWWCDMAIDAEGQCTALWRPNLPSGDEIRANIEAYRAGRNALLQEWATASGIPVTIIETVSEMADAIVDGCWNGGTDGA
jgi:hypothetical protein